MYLAKYQRWKKSLETMGDEGSSAESDDGNTRDKTASSLRWFDDLKQQRKRV